MKKILVIFGTRPEIVKLAPVISELQKHVNIFDLKIVATAQHREMFDQISKVFGINPDIDLDLMQPNQALSDLTSRSTISLANVLETEKPDYIFVQGDTTTAMVAGLIGFYHKIPIGHVEAGLRTGNRYSPFPEEMNRRLLGPLASHHFVPTKRAMEALISEGTDEDSIYITGNTVVDALIEISRIPFHLDFKFINNKNRLIIVTAHRRENWGKGLQNICRAIDRIVDEFKDVDIVYPVHLNPNVRATVFPLLEHRERIWLIDPLDYITFLHLMKNSYLILTDSGGIQEEAPSLGKPVLVLRNETERQEGIETGNAKLVGQDEDRIFESTRNLLVDPKVYKNMSKAINPYGDGKAAQRIINILKKIL